MNIRNVSEQLNTFKEYATENKWVAVALFISSVVLFGGLIALGEVNLLSPHTLIGTSSHILHALGTTKGIASTIGVGYIGLVLGVNTSISLLLKDKRSTSENQDVSENNDVMNSAITNVYRKNLLEAVREDNLEEVRSLIQNKDPEDQDIQDAFVLAATVRMNEADAEEKEVRNKILKAFIELGVDINAKSSDGRTALHSAAISEDTGLVQYLLDRGIDVNISDTAGFTAAHYAMFHKEPEIALSIINSGKISKEGISKIKDFSMSSLFNEAARLLIVEAIQKQESNLERQERN